MRRLLIWAVTVIASLSGVVIADDGASAKLVLAHYMPWFEAKPVSPQWGWGSSRR